MPRIVHIVEANPTERRRMLSVLSAEPVTVQVHDCASKFLDECAATASGCVIVPIDLAGIGVRKLIDEIKQRQLAIAVVVIGRQDSDVASAVEVVRGGAFDFLEQPFSDRRLRVVVREAISAG